MMRCAGTNDWSYGDSFCARDFAAAAADLRDLPAIDYSWSEVRFDSSTELTVHAAMAPPDYDVSPEDVVLEESVNVAWQIA